MIERILVVAPHLGALTDYARTLEALTARRCQVHVAVHGDPPPGTDLSPFTGKFHRLTIGSAPPPDKWLALGTAIRARLGCWQQLDRHPMWQKGLKAIEHRLPSSPGVLNFLRAHEPDVVIVVPLFDGGWLIPGCVQAAAELRIPTVGFPSRWDDLTHGVVLPRIPDCLALWNRFQRRQAVDIRGVPARRTTVLGASLALDIVRETSAFVREPGRFVIFCAPGASPDRDRIARWIESVRTSPDPMVRDAHLLIHLDPPGGVQQTPHALPGNVDVVPRVEGEPAQYSADVAGALASADVVVVWDTTMLFEAAARGIPVVAMLWPESADPGLARFCADESMSGGWLVAARTLAEQTSAISALLAKPPTAEQRAAARAIVRPHGPDLLPGFILSARALQEVIDRRAEVPAAAPAPAWARRLLSPLATLALRRAKQLVPQHHGSRFARVLVGISSAKSLFLHQPLLRVLVERGHQLNVVFTAREGFPVELYDKVKCDIPNVTVAGVLPERGDPWAAYSHWLIGAFSLGSLARRRSADRRAPGWLARYAGTVLPGRARRVGSLMLRVSLAARLLPRIARAASRLIPSSTPARTLILDQSPDIVAVLPDDDAVAASESTGTQLDLIGAAESLGVPVIAAAGTSELQVHPLAMSKARLMCVWNDEQRRAAVNLGAPADRVVVTGALPLDRALHENPVVDAQGFRDMLGLPSDRPFVFFAGSSGLMSEPAEEVDLIREWVKSLRTGGDAALRQLVVLIRPSPFGISRWRTVESDGVGGGVVLCPREFHRTGELDAVLLAESVRFAALTISADPLTLLIAAGLGRPAALVLPPRFATPGVAIPLDYLWKTEGSSVRYTPTLAELSEYAREVLNGWQAPSADQFRRLHLQPRPDVVPAVAVADCIEKAVAESRRSRNRISTETR